MENRQASERVGPTSAWAPPSFGRSVGFVVLALGFVIAVGPRLARNGADLNALKNLRPTGLAAPDAPAGPSLTAPPAPSLRANPLGPRTVSFRLLAPAAQAVFVGGSFNDFNAAQYPLARGDDGVWSADVPLNPGRYAYKFKVDGEWLLDPTNPERTPAPKESSVLEVP
ncbi:MAG: hypothetical protein E6Q99_09150 [Elusimicrobia bacterium]|nr:MAG: hypothetical protein E6Q99_09150 [Elusimicrobiota bacterium]